MTEDASRSDDDRPVCSYCGQPLAPAENGEAGPDERRCTTRGCPRNPEWTGPD